MIGESDSEENDAGVNESSLDQELDTSVELNAAVESADMLPAEESADMLPYVAEEVTVE